MLVTHISFVTSLNSKTIDNCKNVIHQYMYRRNRNAVFAKTKSH